MNVRGKDVEHALHVLNDALLRQGVTDAVVLLNNEDERKIGIVLDISGDRRGEVNTKLQEVPPRGFRLLPDVVVTGTGTMGRQFSINGHCALPGPEGCMMMFTVLGQS